MSEPVKFYAGDTVSWSRTLADYPASDWVLYYDMVNSTGKIEITAQANGDDYLVKLDAATTGTYIPGQYQWVAYVKDIATGAQKFTVDTSPIEILANISGLNAYDARSWAKRSLDAVEAVIEKRASIDQQSYSIQGRSLSRMAIDELIKLREYFKTLVSSETDKESISEGKASSKRVRTYF